MPVGSGSPAALRRLWVRSPEEANFRLPVKKNPRLLHVQSTVESGLTHKATGLVYGWGRGSGVFLVCYEKIFYLSNNVMGAVLPPQVKFFFLSSDSYKAAGLYIWCLVRGCRCSPLRCVGWARDVVVWAGMAWHGQGWAWSEQGWPWGSAGGVTAPGL